MLHRCGARELNVAYLYPFAGNYPCLHIPSRPENSLLCISPWAVPTFEILGSVSPS